jgi:hypothetical protein
MQLSPKALQLIAGSVGFQPTDAGALALLYYYCDLSFIRQGESAATESRKAPKQFRPFPKSSSSGNQELYGK